MKRLIGNIFVVVLCCAIAYSAIVLSLAARRAQDVSPMIAIVNEEDASDSLQDSLVLHGYDPESVVDSIAMKAIETQAVTHTSDTAQGGIREGALTLLAELVAPPLSYVRIEEGMRVEEAGDRLAKSLEWDEYEVSEFVGTTDICSNDIREGNLMAATYAIGQETPPEVVRGEMERTFDATVEKIIAETQTPLDERTILTIASLIQREAAGPEDMKLISGIIWNRIFMDMKLDIDATLQYAKADAVEESGNDVATWWPIVRSKDKYIDSPFNTYQNEGLPPGPIATPSEEAILAAISPDETECIFYLHDAKRKIHCAKDYATHKKNIYRFL
jgi:cell division protein YceG involved in septum cleavage